MTTSTLRPNATVSGGGATFTGGAGNWHGNTSDDSDASYAVLAVGPAAILSLGTVSLPAGSVTKQLRVRMRVRADSSTTNPLVSVTNDGATITTLQQSSVGTSITTYTGSYVPVTLTQTEVDGLTIAPTTKEGSAASCRWVELYADLVYATVPTINVFSPTGTVTISNPGFGIDYTQGSDGGAQTRLHLKVFESAVYGGGGFDPETSVALYDSGEIVTSNPSGTVDAAFNQDYTNLRLYVKAAQTVNGAAHWSDWDSSTFTVDLTTPIVDSVTPVATSASGLITVTVARDTGEAAWTAVTVERSEDAGTTWLPVRGATVASATNTFATYAANSFVVVDYEAPNGVSVTYRARAHDATTVSPWVSASPTSWSSTSVWLKNTANPTANLIVSLPGAADYTVADTRTQTLQLQTTTANAATNLETLLGPIRRVGVFHVIGATHPVTVQDAGDTLLLQYPATFGLDDMYVTVTGYTRGFPAPGRSQKTGNIVYRLFTVDTVEVDRPPDTTST